MIFTVTQKCEYTVRSVFSPLLCEGPEISLGKRIARILPQIRAS